MPQNPELPEDNTQSASIWTTSKDTPRTAQMAAGKSRNIDRMKSSTTTTNVPAKTKTFLDLDYDIRAQIYGILESIPDHSSDDSKHLANPSDGWATTRKSLLLTCRAIHKEFAPHFLRSTTICLHCASHTSDQFTDFLAGLDPVKVINIRHLEYRINRENRDGVTIPGVPEGLFARTGRGAGSYTRGFDIAAEKNALSCFHQLPLGALHLETLEIVRNPTANFYATEVLCGNFIVAFRFPADDWTKTHLFGDCEGQLWRNLEEFLSEYVLPDSHIVRERVWNYDGVRVFLRKSRAQLQTEVQEAEKRLVLT